MSDFSKRFFRAVEQFRSIATELWNSAAESGFCCGIRLASASREQVMPTPSSCCGVRV